MRIKSSNLVQKLNICCLIIRQINLNYRKYLWNLRQNNYLSLNNNRIKKDNFNWIWMIWKNVYQMLKIICLFVNKNTNKYYNQTVHNISTSIPKYYTRRHTNKSNLYAYFSEYFFRPCAQYYPIITTSYNKKTTSN